MHGHNDLITEKSSGIDWDDVAIEYRDRDYALYRAGKITFDNWAWNADGHSPYQKQAVPHYHSRGSMEVFALGNASYTEHNKIIMERVEKI